MKVYVIVEVTHTHARGTAHELVSNVFISEELAQETLKEWNRPETEGLIVRELELIFHEKLVVPEDEQQ